MKVSHLEFYVEEPSIEAALYNILPKMLDTGVTFDIQKHFGKSELLLNLSDRLKRYSHNFPKDWRIVVLVDKDREDCKKLKEQLEKAALDANLITKTNSKGGQFQVLNRIVVEELEAWFFGDIEALVKAYPKLSPNLAKKEKYRNPDAIRGGTWEALKKELENNGYTFGKIKTAREVSEYMNPENNRSSSFQSFRDGLFELLK